MLYLVISFFLFILIINLEVSELIRVLGISYYSQPISQIILLQILLSQIFQVSITTMLITVKELINRWFIVCKLSSDKLNKLTKGFLVTIPNLIAPGT